MKVPALLALAAIASASLSAQEASEQAESNREGLNGDFWEQVTDGVLYEDKKNPWISSVKIEGRAHYQFAWVDGNDAEGSDFNDNFEEFRRLRLGAEVDFLTAFKASAAVNLVEDERFESSTNDLDFGVQDYADAYLRLSLDKLVDVPFFDDLDLTYGRQKVRVGYEAHSSSNDLLTVERSALSNRIRGANARRTGVLLGTQTGDFDFDFGVFSHSDSDFIASWDDGVFYYGSLQWDFAKDWSLLVDGVINEGQGPDEALRYHWAQSVSLLHEGDRFGMAFNFAMGDNGDADNQIDDPDRQGRFYGAVFTPWVWLVQDRLRLVGQVQYQFSDEAEGIRLSDRYLVTFHDADTAEVNNGRGDQHLSAYLGLNFHPWESRTSILAGVQYDDLSTPDGNLDALTGFLALRTSF